jgi:hypothetical protein
LAVLAGIPLGGWLLIGFGVGVVAYTLANPEAREAAGYTLGNALESATNRLQTLFARPSDNQAQNKQFDAAVRELERQLGRVLDLDEIRELHEALHELEDPGYWDIVEEGLNLFDQGDNEEDTEEAGSDE